MNKGYPKKLIVGLSAWLVVAVSVTASGLLAHAQPPLPQILIGVLTLVALAACYFTPELRVWAATADLTTFIVFHLTRFVGAYFLYLGKHGGLPMEFAEPAGWGDLVVALVAVVVLTRRPGLTEEGRKIYLFWNILGAVDILLVVAKAATLWIADPHSMRALTLFPLGLLPTFVVPIIIATHVIIFVRLWQARKVAATPG